MLKLKTDFRVWLAFEDILQTRAYDTIAQLKCVYEYKDVQDLYFNRSDLLTEAYAFYEYAVLDSLKGGVEKSKFAQRGHWNRNDTITFDYKKDYYFLWSSFKSRWGLDLDTDIIHWHKYKTLLFLVMNNETFENIVSCRTFDEVSYKSNYQKAKKALDKDRDFQHNRDVEYRKMMRTLYEITQE